MKRISNVLKLNKSQAELDFIDIEIGRDTPLFLDPAAFHEGGSPFANQCSHDIEEFFEAVLFAANKNDKKFGLELLKGLRVRTH